MGIFNIYIVIPQITAALSLGWIMAHWLGNNQLDALIIAGGMMLISAFTCLAVDEPIQPAASTLPSA